MEEGRIDGLEAVGTSHYCVCGLAVKSVEAWSLADPDAIATVLGIDVKEVRALYPHFRIEEFYQNSGKPEHRPKDLLERIAQLRGRHADSGLRQEIAEHTNLSRLEEACPKGFTPFAEALRAASLC